MKVPGPGNSTAMRRILAILEKTSDLSASDLSREAYVGFSTLTCGGYIRRLREMRLVHVSGWRKTRKGFVTPLYSLGDAPDLPRPVFCNIDRDSAGMARIVDALTCEGPMTYREIAVASGLSANTIKNARYMDVLVEQGRAHICSWRRNRNGPMVAVYCAGGGPAAPRPEALTPAEKSRRGKMRKRVLAGEAPVSLGEALRWRRCI